MSKEIDEFDVINTKLEGLQDIMDKLYDASKSVAEFPTMKKRTRKKILGGYNQAALHVSRATSDFISAHLKIHAQDVNEERQELEERKQVQNGSGLTLWQRIGKVLKIHKESHVQVIAPNVAEQLLQNASCPGKETKETKSDDVSFWNEGADKETQK